MQGGSRERVQGEQEVRVGEGAGWEKVQGGSRSRKG